MGKKRKVLLNRMKITKNRTGIYPPRVLSLHKELMLNLEMTTANAQFRNDNTSK